MDLRIDELANWAYFVYVGGAVITLLRTDARWPARVGLALLWPLGPLAFVVTVSILLAASLIAFPLLGVIVAATAVILALAFGVRPRL